MNPLHNVAAEDIGHSFRVTMRLPNPELIVSESTSCVEWTGPLTEWSSMMRLDAVADVADARKSYVYGQLLPEDGLVEYAFSSVDDAHMRVLVYEVRGAIRFIECHGKDGNVPWFSLHSPVKRDYAKDELQLFHSRDSAKAVINVYTYEFLHEPAETRKRVKCTDNL